MPYKKIKRCYKKNQIVNDLSGHYHQGSDEVGQIELIAHLFSRISMQNHEHPIASHSQRNHCQALVVSLGLGHQLSFFLRDYLHFGLGKSLALVKDHDLCVFALGRSESSWHYLQ